MDIFSDNDLADTLLDTGPASPREPRLALEEEEIKVYDSAGEVFGVISCARDPRFDRARP